MAEHLASEFLVDRPALKHRLDEALSLPLTLLVAQAGAGKSVLLDQWVTGHPEVGFVWIDVEAADDDSVRLSKRLISELAGIRPDVRTLSRLSSLNAGGLGAPMLQALPVALSSFPETVIILDDLHHLSNTTLLGDLGRFVAAIPSNVHVVIATRVDPPIAWSRLRLRNRLLEIRQDALAMSDEESTELFSKITQRPVSPSVVRAMTRRTEGWAAGLQLAAITLKFHERPDEFVAEFGGTDRLIAEYLTEEVLDALPASGRAVLLRMSPLDVMTAGLVDQVLGRDDALGLFERLRQESMFFTATDGSGERFRFHHLFRDLLRYQLRTEGGEEQAILRGAARYHLDRGESAPAVEYLLRAREWTGALDAIMTRGSDVFERGEMSTVVRWITTVPESARSDRRDVTLELGILVGMMGSTARAIDLLSRVISDDDASVGERLIANCFLTATAQWNTRPEIALASAERFLAVLAEHPGTPIPSLMRLTSRESMTTLTLASAARAHFLAGDFDAAEAWSVRSLESEGSSYPVWRIGILGSLALLRIWCGRATEAELLAAEALDVAATARLLNHPVVADAFLAEAMIASERGVGAASTSSLDEGTVRAHANHRTQLEWISRYLRGLLAVHDGRMEEALELVDLSRHDSMSAPSPVILDRLIAMRMRVLRVTGRAAQSLRSSGEGHPTTPGILFEAVAAALALGDHQVAARMLEAGDGVLALDGFRGEIRRSLLAAWAAELRGAHPEAVELVGSALDRAEPEGLTEIFAEAGAVVLGLVAEVEATRGGLAAVIASQARLRESVDANTLLAEPLTDRELQILAYLPLHSTNAELASACYVSINTLKTHMAHIYRKLDAQGRSAAVVRGRELGLIAPITTLDHSRV